MKTLLKILLVVSVFTLEGCYTKFIVHEREYRPEYAYEEETEDVESDSSEYTEEGYDDYPLYNSGYRRFFWGYYPGYYGGLRFDLYSPYDRLYFGGDWGYYGYYGNYWRSYYPYSWYYPFGGWSHYNGYPYYPNNGGWYTGNFGGSKYRSAPITKLRDSYGERGYRSGGSRVTTRDREVGRRSSVDLGGARSSRSGSSGTVSKRGGDNSSTSSERVRSDGRSRERREMTPVRVPSSSRDYPRSSNDSRSRGESYRPPSSSSSSSGYSGSSSRGSSSGSSSSSSRGSSSSSGSSGSSGRESSGGERKR